MAEQPLSRRARYRAEASEEAKEIALRQLAEGGISAVSLNAIGKEMGLTGPALYRYFASRDALLTSLIVDAYRDLAAAVEITAQQNHETPPRDRLRSLAEAARTWALNQPHRYLLIYGTPVPGYSAPEETVALAGRVLAPFLEAIALLPLSGIRTNSHGIALETQLAAWLQVRDQSITAPVMRWGLVWWTRLHGLISLEVEGHFGLMGFDPSLLYASEIEALIDSMVSDGG